LHQFDWLAQRVERADASVGFVGYEIVESDLDLDQLLASKRGGARGRRGGDLIEH